MSRHLHAASLRESGLQQPLHIGRIDNHEATRQVCTLARLVKPFTSHGSGQLFDC